MSKIFRYVLPILLIFGLGLSIWIPAVPVEAQLSGWDNSLLLTIDHTKIDENLTNFPVLIHISGSSGINDDDVTEVFDELTTDNNRKKIAVTTSDGTTQCYVEIAYWSDSLEQAVLFVLVPSISSSVDTNLYLYYDADHPDNTSYVGDVGSTPGKYVWDTANFEHVYHMMETSTGTANEFKDSTSNANHAAGNNPNHPTTVTSEWGWPVQQFDGDNDYAEIPDADGLSIPVPGDFTVEFMHSISVLGMDWATQTYCPICKIDNDAGDLTAEWTYQFYDEDAYTAQARYHWRSFYVYDDDVSGSSPGGNYQPSELEAVDSWYHFAGYATCTDSTHGTQYIYRDGEHQGEESTWQSYGITYTPDFATVIIGHNPIAPSSLWDNARMWEVRFSQVERSQAWCESTSYSNQDNLLSFTGTASGCDVSVAASSDDCIVYDNGSWTISLTSQFTYVGRDPSVDKMGTGMRFVNVNIPAGANITTATITFTAKSTASATTVNGTFTGELSANAATFSDIANYQTRRGTVVGGANNDYITDTQVEWDNIGTWLIGEEYESPDLKTIIQEMVDELGGLTTIVIFMDDHVGESSTNAYRPGESYNTAGGTPPAFHCEWSTTASAPTVTTLAASSILMTEDGITAGYFNANVVDMGEASTANLTFNYGLTVSYGSSTTVQAVTSTGIKSASMPNNLTPGSTYHFRAYLQSAYGTSTGTDRIFTMTMPTIQTNAATELAISDEGITSGYFNGEITDIGVASGVYVYAEYGETTAYGSSSYTQTRTSTGSFSIAIPETFGEGVTYHFRIVAKIGDVYAYGADRTLIIYYGEGSEFVPELANYIGKIAITNSCDTAVTNASANVSGLSVADLIDAAFLNGEDCENIIIIDNNGNIAKFMPGYLTNPWIIFVPYIAPNSILYYTLYTASFTLDRIIYFFLASPFMNIGDDDSLELDDEFTVTYDGRVVTTTEGTLIDKSGAFDISSSGSGNVTATMWGDTNWITPTSYADPTANWTNEENAYDDDTGTGATSQTIAGPGWTEYVEFYYTENISCDGIQFMVTYDDAQRTDMSIDIYYGDAWHNVYEDDLHSANVTYQVSFLPQTTDRMRVRAYIASGSTNQLLKEVDFGQATAQQYLSVDGLTSQYMNVVATADGANFDLYVYDVNDVLLGSDTSVLSGDSVPDTSANWTVGSDATPFIRYVEIKVGGTQAGYWEWEYAATFTDSSGNGNTATPTFRTDASSACLSANITSFKPTNFAIAPRYTVQEAQPFYTQDLEATGGFTTGNATIGTGPPGFGLIEEVAEDTDTPNIWIWGILSCVTIGISGIGLSYARRRFGIGGGYVLVSISIGVVIFMLMIAFHVFDWWMFWYYIIIAGGIAIASRHIDWGGATSQHSLIGFLAMAWLGLTLINNILIGNLLTNDMTNHLNTMTFTQDFSILNTFSIPVINFSFFTEGIPALMNWDYSFFGGQAQILQYMLYSITAVVTFILFILLLGLVYNLFSRARI